MKKLSIVSFGFKYGDPPKANLLFDVRFMGNPHYVADLRPLTGADAPVAEFVLGQTAAKAFVNMLKGLLAEALAGYLTHGHDHQAITIAFGCTGGKHRSVCVAIECYNIVQDVLSLLSCNAQVLLEHRDLGKE